MLATFLETTFIDLRYDILSSIIFIYITNKMFLTTWFIFHYYTYCISYNLQLCLFLFSKFLFNWWYSPKFYCRYIFCDACPCMTLLLINSSLHDICILRLITHCVKELVSYVTVLFIFCFINNRFSEKKKGQCSMPIYIQKVLFEIILERIIFFHGSFVLRLSPKFVYKVQLRNS